MIFAPFHHERNQRRVRPLMAHQFNCRRLGRPVAMRAQQPCAVPQLQSLDYLRDSVAARIARYDSRFRGKRIELPDDHALQRQFLRNTFEHEPGIAEGTPHRRLGSYGGLHFAPRGLGVAGRLS